jgi:hypothetical protein
MFPATEFVSRCICVARVWQEAPSIPAHFGANSYFLHGTWGAWEKLWSPAVSLIEGKGRPYLILNQCLVYQGTVKSLVQKEMQIKIKCTVLLSLGCRIKSCLRLAGKLFNNSSKKSKLNHTNKTCLSLRNVRGCILYSEIIHPFQLQAPTKRKGSPGTTWKLPAKVDISLWLGSTKYTNACFDFLPTGHEPIAGFGHENGDHKEPPPLPSVISYEEKHVSSQLLVK